MNSPHIPGDFIKLSDISQSNFASKKNNNKIEHTTSPPSDTVVSQERDAKPASYDAANYLERSPATRVVNETTKTASSIAFAAQQAEKQFYKARLTNTFNRADAAAATINRDLNKLSDLESNYAANNFN